MTEEKTVLFTTSEGFSYLFDEEKANVMPQDLPPNDFAVPTSRAWSIVDSGVEQQAESSGLINWSLFVILTVSPKEKRYKEWGKQRRALRWVMNPWSKEELCCL